MKNRFMERAIELSLQNVANGRGGPFGALVVQGDRIIAEGTNLVTSANDPTAHAEITAIREACRRLNSFQLSGCEIYTSCEPCPMCMAAIYWARVEKVFYGNTREDAAEIGFDDTFIYDQLRLPIRERSVPIVQIMRDEALEAFRSWENKNDKVRY
jgi:guanine deaminase